MRALRRWSRDSAYLKHGGGDDVSLLNDQSRYLKHSLGFGISQSGRFLRTFLYEGFNLDEQGRKVFDGIWADAGGAGRGGSGLGLGLGCMGSD